MKSIVVVLAGAADHPTEELGGKTPLEAAKVPNLNFFAKSGKVGTAKLVSDRLPLSPDVSLFNILGYDAYKSDQSHRKNFRWTELDELLRESDVVSLHCPLFPATRGIINKDNLRKMKNTAFLINTSRGPLVVDEDLTEALDQGIIAGAGIDVLSVEPPPADNPLLGARNCIITPHLSWATKEARARLMEIAVDNLKAFLAGNPVNIVNR